MDRETTHLDLTQSITALFSMLSRIVNREFVAYGVTSKEYVLMSALLEQGEWSAKELAQATATTTSSLSRIISNLVERGLVARRRPRRDRRLVMVKLTPAGEALGSELRQIVRAHEARLTVGIGAQEMDTLLTAMRKIVANGSTIDIAGDPSQIAGSRSIEVD